jgi:hypothetical protein
VFIAWRFTPLPDEQDTEPMCGPRTTGALVTPPGASTSIRIDENFGVVCEHGGIVMKPVTATRPTGA